MFFSFGREPEKHRFFVVLSKNPKSDPLIYLVSPTTNIALKDRVYQHTAKKPLVWIHPKEFPIFDYFSVIDCKAVLGLSSVDLLNKIQRGKLVVYKNKLPAGKLHEIITIIANDDTAIPSMVRAITG